MNERHRDLHAMMAALGHDSRFRLVLCLLEGERCVGDLAGAIGLSQSCTTRHVQALERAGVVRSKRDGKRVLVGIEADRDGLPQLLDWLAPDPAGPRRPRATAAAATGARRTRSAASRAAGRAAPGRPGPPRPGQGSARPGVPQPTAEAPPIDAPASGTHAPPEQEPPSQPRRPRETLEDFLL